MGKKIDLNEQAEKIIEIAEESGVQSNFLFITTFRRYQVQLSVLNDLEKAIKKEGMLVTKEYVKGRKNLYTSPAVKEYGRMSEIANKTAATLIRIIKSFNVKEDTEEKDPLMAILNGNDDAEL